MIETPPDLPNRPSKPFAEALVDCGLERRGFTVTYDQTLQGNVIQISGDSGANEANVACIWDAAWTEFVRFEQGDLQTAYDAITEARFAPIAQQSARDTLAKLGLLEGLPLRADYPSLQDFAVAIEKHCGLSGNEILRIMGDQIVFAPDPGTVGTSSFERAGCLFSALTASNLPVVLIGNEAVAEPKGE